MLQRSSDGRRTYSTLTNTWYECDFSDDFDGTTLDEGRWLPYYLPHWNGRSLSAARYRVDRGLLRLRIDDDQQPWHAEIDGGVRVSSLQTGMTAGPVGSRRGQVRFHPDLVVREAQPRLRLYTPQYGLITLRAQATDHPRCMVALWMVDPDDERDHSTEICLCEIYGRDVTSDHGVVGLGLKNWTIQGPQPSPAFERLPVQLDLRAFHTYSVEWTTGHVTFFIDDEPVKSLDAAPDHPVQIMLDIYEFPEGHPEIMGAAPAGHGTREFVVDYVRGYRRDTGAEADHR